ncbi:MAG TPA: hypothetical protein VFL91_24370 [Thermomicrobiales bacterium]|nr:hypothetical protein [Thermomicrobiales bacterium]
MDSVPRGFFAYASRPPSLPETIRKAISLINETGAVRLDGWESALRPAGKFMVGEICARIEEREIFACDLTSLNSNVLFELGYAITKRKRVWIVLDGSYSGAVANYNALPLT